MPSVSRNPLAATSVGEHLPAKLNPTSRGLFSLSKLLPRQKKQHPQHLIHAALLKGLAPSKKPNDIASGTHDSGEF
jgi:hypothetical protein